MKRMCAPFHGRGGVHPAYHKELTAGSPIRRIAMPPLLRVVMAQHLGAPAKPVVKKGDAVLKGQVIGEPAGFVSAFVHAPTSGTVRNIVDARTATGQTAKAVEIEPDGRDAWVDTLAPCPDWQAAAPAALKDAVAKAGIVGMGGAGFPTHVKLSPPSDKPIDTLILNGAECEPYLTADHRLMLESAADIVTGCRIIARILGVRTIRIAIEDNKQDAIAAMAAAIADCSEDLAVVELATEYPQGAEKQQIYSVTGREVPSGGLPMDVGAVVENVGTALAIRHAIVAGHPLIERVTSVTGLPVANPGNLLAPVGTPYADLLAACGGTREPAAKVISGGPMMGFAQDNLDITTTKTTSGLLFLAPRQVAAYTSMPCISCGRCVDACPMRLVPSELSQMLEAEAYEPAESEHVLDCIECGCCAYVCPAHRPLVQHMRTGKARAMQRRREQQEKDRK